ncbi:uncharacterized protein SPSK_05462 [Sporothrix schenckii 1099-18]|uniref:SAP domain-containing protein n=2 Tax=Sporothrix schenckii TaxID=29908 RepID=U7Q5I8_SPOS1|nr:uncharacterized protein SPSK_05462 [Sporothrix schenckii 1099-18]ERT02300.1 hypothetical protein HMPREF1624_00598 [Sporothrix schenckii ATCC 58251]KJR80451.1 hypothetical protein SPSK_05462 [Sporothrix schenckii 1099-18]
MTDYASLKVDELKKLLSDRGLPLSGKKADLVSRLQENDAAASKPEAKSNEDEIDWDDEKPAEPAPAAAPPAAAAAKDAPAAAAPAPAPAAAPAAAATTEETAAAAEEPVTAPVASTIDIDEELRRREARAKRFGITPAAADETKAGEDEDEDAKKAAARAARFGIDPAAAAKNKEVEDARKTILSSLDTALPDRPLKRGRGGGDGDRRDKKRSTPDRRHGGNRNDNRNNNNNNNNNRNRNIDRRHNNSNAGGGNQRGQKGLNFLSDPAEKKKAEERAKRFGL